MSVACIAKCKSDAWPCLVKAWAFHTASCRSWVPVPSRWTFTQALPAFVHCTSAALRPPGFACFRSSLVGTGTRSLVNRVSTRRHPERKQQSEHASPGDRKPPMSTSGRLKTLAFHPSAPGKADRMSAFSAKEASCGRSGLPVPSRWTFTQALLAFVHCTSAALRPPGFACFRSSLVGTGTPSLVNGVATRGHPERKQRSEHASPGGRKPPMSTGGGMKTLAFHSSAPGKADRMLAFSVKLVQETGQLFAAGRGLQFPDRLGFDLPDSLAGHLEDVAHLFQGVAVAVAESVPELDDFPFTV